MAIQIIIIWMDYRSKAVRVSIYRETTSELIRYALEHKPVE
jgi:hypothetical protein